jgi:hypothetical protein
MPPDANRIGTPRQSGRLDPWTFLDTRLLVPCLTDLIPCSIA